jgi:cytochrome o ubiquinol oxidase subunit 2
LHLVADNPETMQGENTQYNGRGFTKQKFSTRAMQPDEFTAWGEGVRENGRLLDASTYQTLAMRTDRDEVQTALGTDRMPKDALYFTLDGDDLFHSILHRYHSGKPLPKDQQPGTTSFGQEASQ